MTNNPTLDLILATAKKANENLDKAEENLRLAQEHLEGIIGRGPGDPDVYGYPGQEDDPRTAEERAIDQGKTNPLDEEIPF